ncbi:MAG: tetratricopeptide repeat protein [Acidobacteriota bacterium]
MKRCPQCNRIETDEALKFCRVDGATLVSDSSSLNSEAGTAQLGSQPEAGEVHTSILPHNTHPNVNRATGPTTALPMQVSAATGTLTTAKGRKPLAIAVVVAAVFLAVIVIVVSYVLPRKSSARIDSIAVLPFVNASGNADLEYLSDGMTETLMGNLSQIPNLHVKARSLVFRYKGKETNPQTIGQELNVQAILNGRVVQHGTDLILYLELVDAATGNLIWSDSYNRKQTDLVSLQRDIARDVSSKLRIKVSGVDEQKLAKSYTVNSEAYRLFLQGRYFANKRTPKETLKAIEYFQQAINIDPNYALAYGGLAVSYSYLTIYGNAPAAETLPKARQFALKAIELDSSEGGPHLLLGLFMFLQDHDLAGWERETKRALELSPNSSDAHRLNGFRLTTLGQHDEAIAEVKRSLEIEPLSAAGNVNYAWTLFYAGRVDEGEAQGKRSAELFPDFWLSHYFLSEVYRFRGNYALAMEEFARMKELREEAEAARLVRESFSKGGWPAFLATVTKEQVKVKLSPYHLATFYTELGDKDKAFATLNEAVDKSDQFIGFIKVDPSMKPLQSDPRFPPLLKRIGFP